MSQKSTVTCLRSPSRRAATGVSAAPQSAQKRFPSLTSAPHCGQLGTPGGDTVAISAPWVVLAPPSPRHGGLPAARADQGPSSPDVPTAATT